MTGFPDPEMIYRCDFCQRTAVGEWPHRIGDPCPWWKQQQDREEVRKDEANDAYILKLQAEKEAWEAQRDYYRRPAAGSYPPEMLELIERQTKFFQDQIEDR